MNKIKKTKEALNDKDNVNVKDDVDVKYNVKDDVILNEKEEFNENGDECVGIFTSIRTPLVSLFENVFSKEPVRDVRLDKFLFTNKFKERVKAYRASSDNESRKKIKKGLPCITPSGTFSQRRVSGIIKHTGLVCS